MKDYDDEYYDDEYYEEKPKKLTLFRDLMLVLFIMAALVVINDKATEKIRKHLAEEEQKQTQIVKKEVAYNSEAAAIVGDALKEGWLFRYNKYDAKFYVNPLVWLSIDYVTKRNLTIACAHYYVSKGGGILRSKIYDNHSGKLLAGYGAFGFKVY